MILLPGLYLAFLAFLLGWALRRFWDPVSWRAWAVFGLVVLLLLGPALFAGKVLLPLDILPGLALSETEVRGNPLQLDLVTQIVPAMAQVRREVGAGEWPFWNPLAGAGMPLLADPQSQVLQPLVLLAFPLPLPQAVGVIAGLKLLVALVFFFLFLRRQGISETAALFGSVSYGMGGFLLLWLGWPISNTAALLPLVLYAIVKTDERGAGGPSSALLGIAAFAVLTAGHPETILYGVIVSVLFAGARLLARPGDRGKLLARWAVTGAIAFGLAAPALLPLIRYLPQTHREEMVARRNERVLRDPVFSGWESAGAGKRLTAVIAPAAFGDHRVYWGEMNVNEDASGFVGTAALLAALLAFVPGARRFPQERLFLALAAVSLLVIARPPGLPRLLTALPLLDRSPTFHHRTTLILAFSLAYLAACTVERWRAGEGRRTAVVVGALLLGTLILWGYHAWPLPENAAALAAAQGFQLGVLLIAAILFALRPRVLAVPAVLAVLELYFLFGKANPSLPREGFYPETPAVAFLRENLGEARFVGIGNRLRPNASVLYDFEDVRISNPLKPWLYTRMLAPVSNSVRDINDLLVRTEHPLYQLLGARYVVAPPKVRPRREERRFLRPVLRDRSTWIFERTRVLPVLFLPTAAETPGGRDWIAWVGENPDFSARALVQPGPGRPDRWSAVDPESSALDLLSLRPAHLAARARLGEDRLLATSVYQDGGWRLLVDGRPAGSTLANGPFVAAWLPAGERRVDLLYRPPGFLLGIVLAALALTGAVAALVTIPSSSRLETPLPADF